MVFELLQLFSPVFTETLQELVSIIDGVNTGEIFNQDISTLSLLQPKLKQLKYANLVIENKTLSNQLLLV